MAIVVLLPASPVRAQGFQWPDRLENAKVLPDSIGGEELSRLMRGFASALGVRCLHCHVGEQGQSLSEFDYVSDEKPAKEMARVMIRMVREINGEFLPMLAREDVQRVTCETCHRGVRTPQPLDELLFDVASTEGADAAVERYRELREVYFGSDAYDFGEGTLAGAGSLLSQAGMVDAAIALYRLNTEYFADSGNTFMMLGLALIEAGSTEDGIRELEKALELVTNPRARDRIQQAIDRARE